MQGGLPEGRPLCSLLGVIERHTEKILNQLLTADRKNHIIPSLSNGSVIINPGVAQLVARMVRDHEAVSSNLATRTMGEFYKELSHFYLYFQFFRFLLHKNMQYSLF